MSMSQTALATFTRIEESQPDPSALSDLWREVNTDDNLTFDERRDALGRIQNYLDDHVAAAQAASSVAA